MSNSRRWWFVAIAGTIFALVLAITVAFALTWKARGDAAKYLQVVMPLRIGTPYHVVAAQLHDAGLRVISSGDCRQDCMLTFHADDRWLYEFHFAPSIGFNGWLNFRGATLVYKSTSMGQDVMVWSATVSEGSPPGGSLEPGVAETQDTSGNVRHLSVHLSVSDFTENRKNAYAFNVACIGAIRVCKADEYLPTKVLKRGWPR